MICLFQNYSEILKKCIFHHRKDTFLLLYNYSVKGKWLLYSNINVKEKMAWYLFYYYLHIKLKFTKFFRITFFSNFVVYPVMSFYYIYYYLGVICQDGQFRVSTSFNNTWSLFKIYLCIYCCTFLFKNNNNNKNKKKRKKGKNIVNYLFFN